MKEKWFAFRGDFKGRRGLTAQNHMKNTFP